LKNITEHIPISKTAIEIFKTKIEKEDRTAYTDEQVTEFLKSNRIVGDAREFWKERREEPLQPQIEWEI